MPEASVHFSSATSEWETPPAFFAELDAEFHFTLDPCCVAETAKCTTYFTPEQNGLALSWFGHRVYMNSPYGDEIGDWIAKAWHEVYSSRAELVVCLIPARTDTAWFHDYCMRGEIRLLKGRLKFLLNGKEQDAAPFPSALVIFRRVK